jgi:exodeoxyribonuclease-3
MAVHAMRQDTLSDRRDHLPGTSRADSGRGSRTTSILDHPQWRLPFGARRSARTGDIGYVSRVSISPTTTQRLARAERRAAALARRETMSPLEPAVDRFRVATWNVNSLKVRASAVERFLLRVRPDVLLLQETKASSVHASAQSVFDGLGYEVAHVGSGGYNGVAIASSRGLHDVVAAGEFGSENLDLEPRLISALVGGPNPIRVASVYVPHGREVGHAHYEYKLRFLGALRDQVREWLDAGHVLVGGDVNVAPTDSDIFHPDAFVGLTHVSQPERDALARTLDGLVDLDAVRWGPHERRFTWWSHGLNYSRNLGMRIDLLAADAKLAERLDTTWIDHIERGMQRPSDHAALLADFRNQSPA